jgi:REP element-mobilizing transposase RayT
VASAGPVGGTVDTVAPPRIIDPYGIYHLGTKGNFGGVIFEERADFEKFLELYARAARRRRWTTLDWCLLHNHVHFLVKLNGGGLSEGMQEVNGCYSKWLNRKKGRTGQGHTFKNRFFSDLIQSELHFRMLFAYIALNPVEAGLCDDPGDWEWSGCGAALRRRPGRPFHDTDALLSHFGLRPTCAIPRYERFLDDALLRARSAVLESAA